MVVDSVNLAQVWANFSPGFSRWVLLNSVCVTILLIHQFVDWFTGCHAARKNGVYSSSIGSEGIKKKANADAILIPIAALDVGFRFMRAVVGDSVTEKLWSLAANFIPKLAEVDPGILDLGVGAVTIFAAFMVANELASICENEEKMGNDVPEWAKWICGRTAKVLDGPNNKPDTI